MEILLLMAILLSFIITFLLLEPWIKKSEKLGLVWEDMNKKNKKKVSSSGGIVALMGFVLGVLYYIAIRTFLYESTDGISLQIFSLLSVILIFAILGLVDDLMGWKHGGLSTKLRIMLAFVASIPLVVINAGTHSMSFPFLGSVSLGLLYPLFLIPLGIAGASITYNFLAGFNGLESGQGILILSFLSFVAYTNNNQWLAMIGLIMVGSLIAFYYYNKFPARVFPGDSLTWSVGGLIAIMAILGNFERVAVVVFIPYIIEVVLKSRGGLKKHSFAKPNKDGSLEMPYKKIYGLTHFSLWFLKKFKAKVYEKDVVYMIFAIQIIFILFGFLMLGV